MFACFFPPFQLSIVEYDPGTHDLKTLSLHYFEEPELRVCTAFMRMCWTAVLWRCMFWLICAVCLNHFRMGLFRMCTFPWCEWTQRTAAPSCWCTAPAWWFCPSGRTRWPMSKKGLLERGMNKYFLDIYTHCKMITLLFKNLLCFLCYCMKLHLPDQKYSNTVTLWNIITTSNNCFLL